MSTVAIAPRRPDVYADPPPPRGPALLLAAVAVVFVGLQLLLVGLRFGLGWDETVYASQVSSRAPALYWSAPRARGIPVLIAPVVHFTSSVPALRLYLALLGGIGLVLAYRPWLRVRPGWAVPLGAAAFASLWITQFYGNEAMPNFWVALLAVAAAGYFVRYRQERGGRVPLAGVAGSLAGLSLIRPTDSLYLAAPMVVAALASRPRWRPALAVAGGVLFGWAAWTVEAYIGFGGLLTRLRDARAEDAGAGLHANVLLFFRTLGGPIECCQGYHGAPRSHVLLAGLWWPAAAVLLAVGLIAARGPLRRAYLLAVAMAALLAAQYFFLLSVVGVRHLLPAYALVALPVGEGLCAIVAATRPGPTRAVVAGLLAVLALGHLAVRLAFLHVNVRAGTSGRAAPAVLAAALPQWGVTQPCVLIGPGIPPYAYAAGCRQLGFNAQLGRRSARALRAAARAGEHPAVVLRADDPRWQRLLPGWQRHVLRGPHLYRVVLAPPYVG